MKYVISRYNHDLSWLPEYTTDPIIYDRSEERVEGSIDVPNLGSDIYDKLSFIIDNYDNLPDVTCLIKANLFKYVTKQEFDLIKDNTTFTPIFTKHHKETWKDLESTRLQLMQGIEKIPNPELREIYYRLNQISPNEKAPTKRFSFYDEDGMYNELNIPAFINTHPLKNGNIRLVDEIQELMGVKGQEYLKFAPGSNYILPKKNIMQNSKEFYIKLRSYLDWSVYPAEAMIIERGLYTIWK